MDSTITSPTKNEKRTAITQLLTNIITSLLVLLWTYTAFSKLADLEEFQSQLNNQVFGITTTKILLWSIPTTELLAAALLLFERTKKAGLISSALLMTAFTGYIALVLTGYYQKVPCSCGGVLKQLGWQSHLWFNLFFLALSITGSILHKKHYKNPATPTNQKDHDSLGI